MKRASEIFLLYPDATVPHLLLDTALPHLSQDAAFPPLYRMLLPHATAAHLSPDAAIPHLMSKNVEYKLEENIPKILTACE